MPAPLEISRDLRVKLWLQLNAFALEPLPARSVERGLRVHTVIHGVDDDLQVSLRLHEPAHHAERANRLFASSQEAGNDRVIRALARLEVIGVRWIQREVRAAIL